jgi:uncharacterized protein (TIGR03437 family)
MRYGLLSGLLLALAAEAQLIPSGTPVPVTTLPPVVFINGFQFEGCPSTFAGTFGIADQVLQSNGEVSLFFSTCSLPSSASIEDLAGAFATFLGSLQFSDGKPVETVDVVAHSMGGLVLRAYLSGKQDASGVFQPPVTTHVRKAVFLATPNFGTPLASLPIASVLGFTKQLDEMSSGSSFLFGLGTWNDGTDDLRGVDAVAAAGNAGIGGLGDPSGFDDGVVPLTSASLQFYLPGRTRVVPYCHIDGGGIITLFNLCSGNAQGIADINSAMHDSAQIIVSFLNGTSDWQSVGTAAAADPFLSVDGGLIIAAHAADDSPEDITFAQVVDTAFPMFSQTLSISSNGIAFSDLVHSGSIAVEAAPGSSNTLKLLAGGTQPFLFKDGPQIARVFSAAAANYPLELAPRMIVAIYGTQMMSATVTAGGSPLTPFYTSATQIDVLLPDGASGLTPITVQNSAGQNTVNVYVGAAAPAIFTQDSSGSGPASALKAIDQSLVTASNPLHPGDAVELYATGLGLTTSSNGFDVAVEQPTVTVGGVACPVTFAGAAPGFEGLDQINCTIPAGAASNSAAPVVVTSGDRTSNTATLAIE